MPTPRTGLAADALNGKIYAIGGTAHEVTADGCTIFTLFGGTSISGPCTTVEEYDPLTDSWSTKAAMPTVRWGHAVAAVNGKVHAIGGAEPLFRGGLDPFNLFPENVYFSTMEEFDPLTDSWSTKAAMPTARSHLAAATVNGKIYAIGGFIASDTFLPEPIATVEEYDPLTDSWSTKAPMPTARARHTATTVNGKIYVIGGSSTTYDTLTTVEEYDPLTNSWSTKAPMPTTRDSHTATAVNGKIYAIGGSSTGFDVLATVEEYDPLTNTWSTRTAMPTFSWGHAAAAVNGKIYAIGGNSTISSLEEFLPQSSIVTVDLVINGSGDTVGENISHSNGNVYNQVLLSGQNVSLRTDGSEITRLSFLDINDDIVQVEFSGNAVVTVSLDPDTFIPAAPSAKYNQPTVNYVKGHPTVQVEGADENTFLSIFTVGSINAVNQALFPEGEVYDAMADVALVEITNSTGFGGILCANTRFSGSTGKVGINAPDVPVSVRILVGDIDASGEAIAHLNFGDNSFTVAATNPGLRITGGDLMQTNGAAIVIAPSGSTTPGFDSLISQNNVKSDGTEQPTKSIATTFSNADGQEINITVDEITIE